MTSRDILNEVLGEAFGMPAYFFKDFKIKPVTPSDIKQMEARAKTDRLSNSIKKVVFNDPAVVILWKDGTKTTVKCQKGDKYDKEKGLALAIVKHLLGDTGYYNTIFEKWLEKDED